MTGLSISKKHGRSPKKRSYRMRRRAEQIDETRQRITEAAVKLHTTIGPAHTSIAKVAGEADVTRLTVYRHFADLDALFVACMGHWNEANPAPDVAAWQPIEPLEDRARAAFRDLYDWYAEHDEDLYPIYRDFAAMPESAKVALAAQQDGLAAVILGADGVDGSRIVTAVARHLVDFWTWRSLVVERGLGPEEGVEAAVRMLLAPGSIG